MRSVVILVLFFGLIKFDFVFAQEIKDRFSGTCVGQAAAVTDASHPLQSNNIAIGQIYRASACTGPCTFVNKYLFSCDDVRGNMSNRCNGSQIIQGEPCKCYGRPISKDVGIAKRDKIDLSFQVGIDKGIIFCFAYGNIVFCIFDAGINKEPLRGENVFPILTGQVDDRGDVSFTVFYFVPILENVLSSQEIPLIVDKECTTHDFFESNIAVFRDTTSNRNNGEFDSLYCFNGKTFVLTARAPDAKDALDGCDKYQFPYPHSGTSEIPLRRR